MSGRPIMIQITDSMTISLPLPQIGLVFDFITVSNTGNNLTIDGKLRNVSGMTTIGVNGTIILTAPELLRCWTLGT